VLIVKTVVRSVTTDGIHLVGIQAKEPDFRIVVYFVDLEVTETRRV